ncbi:MAG TPA: DUF1302 family protein, partial [Nitrospiria bacterium]|nr:DUF1302 family protein [Nitrospiria bacterium]
HFSLNTVFIVLFTFYLSLFTLSAAAQEVPPPQEAAKPPSAAVEEVTSSSKFSYSGYFRQESAVRIYSPVVFTKIMSYVRIETHYTFSEKVQLTVIPMAYYDAAPDLAQIDFISRIIGPSTVLTENPSVQTIAGTDVGNLRGVDIENKDAEFREVYLDVHLPALDLRLGRQIVRWGVVEGSRIVDEINPLDFKEFILRDVVDRYIPRWMVKSDLYLGETAIEGLYIPDLEFNKPAPLTSQFEQFQILPGTIVPADTIQNADWGARISRNVLGADFSLSYYYMWDPFPAAYRSAFGLGGFDVSPTVGFQPRYTKLRVYGGTFSRSFGKVVFSAEGALVFDKYFGTLLGVDPANPASFIMGETMKNYVKYAAGIDINLFSTDLSFGMQQQKILNYDSNIIMREYETVLSFFGRRPFLNDRLTPSVLALYFMVDNDTLLRPKIEYRMTDRLKLSAGLDMMIGSIGGPLPGNFHFIGFFKNESRVEFDVTYGF